MVIPRERSLEEDCSHEETDDDGEIGESEGDYRDVYHSNELEGAVGYSLPISGVSEEENNENGFSEFEQYHSVQIRRPLGLELRHNHHDINYNQPREVSDETVLLGSELYINFLREEIRRLNLQEPECLMPQYARNPPIRSQNVTNFGLRLRHVANAFAEAPLRQVVKEKAECVNWDDLDFQSFSDLLFGLFQEGGVTSERVVVLFYFCSDLAVRALRDNITERFHTVTQWSQLYIVQSLSLWIQQNGGWATVLQQSVTEAYRLAMIGFCCVGILALAVLIRNNMKT